jgi:sulfur dioxygenase
MFRSVREQIFSLPDSCFLYPRSRLSRADGYQCRRGAPLQPRLSGEIGEGDFTGYMKNLRLAHPKKMDVAVPANLKCGRPETDPVATEDPTWAPLKYSFAGIWEIDPHGIEEHAEGDGSPTFASLASSRNPPEACARQF